MKHDYIIHNSQLTLRPIAYSDLEQIRGWRNEESIRKWFFSQDVIEKAEQKEWFEKYLNTDDDIMFVVEYSSRLIGTAALYNVSKEEQSAEFGRLMIGEESVRGLRIGEKITESICDFGFNILDLGKIELKVFEENARAIRIYSTLGFVKETEVYLNNKKMIKMSMTRNQHFKKMLLRLGVKNEFLY